MFRRKVAVLVLLCAGAMATAQDNFSDFPEEHGYLRAAFRLRQFGLLKGSSQWSVRRRQMAKELVDSIDDLPRTFLNAVHDAKLSKPNLEDKLAVNLRDSAYVAGFTEMIDALTPEIVNLGRHPSELRATLRRCRRITDQIEGITLKPAFSDQPKGHWASKALTDLKAAGILIGDPDGRFRG